MAESQQIRTFTIVTLGCKVNQYESDQIATLLRGRGLRQVEQGGHLRIVNTCSVTVQAASKSRQSVRRTVGRKPSLPLPVLSSDSLFTASQSFDQQTFSGGRRARVIVTGCWATSDPAEAARLSGVDAVLGHQHDVAAELD